MINCEINLILAWSGNCNLTNKTTQDVVSVQGANPARPVIGDPINATFKITDTKLHVPVVTLSIQDDNKLLEQ